VTQTDKSLGRGPERTTPLPLLFTLYCSYSPLVFLLLLYKMFMFGYSSIKGGGHTQCSVANVYSCVIRTPCTYVCQTLSLYLHLLPHGYIAPWSITAG